MRVLRLSVKNVRLHERYELTLSPRVTLLTGANGSGKTSLIEALYIAFRGKSFRGSDEMIRRSSAQWYRIDVATDSGDRTMIYDARGERVRKEAIVDDKKSVRLPQAAKYPIVLFEPDDLRLISGSPARRRDVIDHMISQYDPAYATSLSRYDRALLQRNKLLKSPAVSPDQLFSWNVMLSEYGAYIIDRRQRVIAAFDAQITEVYRMIARTDDTVQLGYSDQSPYTAQRLLRHYEAQYERDVLVGSTSVGPHRHDLVVTFNGRPASTVTSRGEARTIVLALKFLEARYIQQQTGLQPLVLLDDVFGELDGTRQQHLLSEFHDHQIVMTSANGDESRAGDAVIVQL